MTGGARRDNGTLPDQDTTQKATLPSPQELYAHDIQVRAAKTDAGKDVPRLSAALIGKYISDL